MLQKLSPSGRREPGYSQLEGRVTDTDLTDANPSQDILVGSLPAGRAFVILGTDYELTEDFATAGAETFQGELGDGLTTTLFTTRPVNLSASTTVGTKQHAAFTIDPLINVVGQTILTPPGGIDVFLTVRVSAGNVDAAIAGDVTVRLLLLELILGSSGAHP